MFSVGQFFPVARRISCTFQVNFRSECWPVRITTGTRKFWLREQHYYGLKVIPYNLLLSRAGTSQACNMAKVKDVSRDADWETPCPEAGAKDIEGVEAIGCRQCGYNGFSFVGEQRRTKVDTMSRIWSRSDIYQSRQSYRIWQQVRMDSVSCWKAAGQCRA